MPSLRSTGSILADYGEVPCRRRGAPLPTTGSSPADPLAQGVGDQDAQSDWGRPRVCIIIHDNNIIIHDNARTMPRKVTSSRAIVGVGGESAPRKRCEAEGSFPSTPPATLEATSLKAHIGRGQTFEEAKRQGSLPDSQGRWAGILRQPSHAARGRCHPF